MESFVDMTLEVRPIRDDEMEKFHEIVSIAFGEAPHPDYTEYFRKWLDVDRTLCAFDDGRMVGTSAAFAFDVTIPGGALPTAGVTMIGVAPTHRRKGALTKMMRGLIDKAHEDREPLAALWASEESIYQRFGYGMAAFECHIDLDKGARFLNDEGPRGTTRFISLDEAAEVLPPIYERIRRDIPGMLSRSDNWWRSRTLRDLERDRDGGSQKMCAVLNIDGHDTGYVIYRTFPTWSDDVIPGGRLELRELMAIDAVSEKELWRFVTGVDLIQKIKGWYLPQDLPLQQMLLEPRRLRLSHSESFWLRLVDVKAALEARSYDADGELVLEIRDPYCEWNAGTWTLTVESRRAQVAPAAVEADLSLDVSALAAVYLGGFSFEDLRRALRIEEHELGAIERADRMFRTARAPWCPENF